MSLHALGKVTVVTAGTPVEVTINQTTPSARYAAHSFMVEALPANTGKIYVGFVGLNKGTLANVLAIIPVPTVNLIPSFSSTIAYAPGGFNLADIYIDADVNGEGALVSAIRG